MTEATYAAGSDPSRTGIATLGSGFGGVYTPGAPECVFRGSPSLNLARVGDCVRLARPRLALLVLVTVGAGWFLAAGTNPDWKPLAHALIDTALLFVGATALNQLLERHSDALMPRTAQRPLPAGKLEPWQVLMLGCTLSAVALVDLVAERQFVAASLGAFALVSYVFVYTPLKRLTTLNTLIGAIPGAMPPLIGWAAAGGRPDAGALALFAIVFLWQVPHFLAIGWIYRDQYSRAGLRMLPVFDQDGTQTGREMVRYILVLILASLVPFVLGTSGWMAGIGALILGAVFLCSALVFARTPTTQHARHVFRASLLFLPALLVLFALDAILVSGR